MILILGYNNSETVFLNRIIEKNNVEFKYSLRESDIMNAEKIILPNPNNFNSTYRKLNMVNLFSMLRIVKKPIMGINNGSRLMCKKLLNNHKSGLGIFNIDVDIHEEYIEASFKEVGEIIVDEKFQYFYSINNNKIFFNSDTQQEAFDCSKIIIRSNDKKYSLMHVYNNFYGLEIDIERNQQIAEEIITSFIQI